MPQSFLITMPQKRNHSSRNRLNKQRKARRDMRSTRLGFETLESRQLLTAVTWYLDGVQYDTGATASGSFDFDADTVAYSNINITTAGSPHQGTTTYGVPNPLSLGSSTFFQAVAETLPDMTGVPVMALSFASPITNAGGTVNILPGPTNLSYQGMCNANCGQSDGPFDDVCKPIDRACATAKGDKRRVAVAVAVGEDRVVNLGADAGAHGISAAGRTVGHQKDCRAAGVAIGDGVVCKRRVQKRDRSVAAEYAGSHSGCFGWSGRSINRNTTRRLVAGDGGVRECQIPTRIENRSSHSSASSASSKLAATVATSKATQATTTGAQPSASAEPTIATNFSAI